MVLISLIILSLFPQAIAKVPEKSVFPKVGFMSENTEVCYKPGECGDQFTTWIHRGAQIQVIQEKPVANDPATKFYQYKCVYKKSGSDCWVKADKFLSSATNERAAILKDGLAIFSKPDIRAEKGKSNSQKGDIAFVTKKDNGYCFANLAPDHNEWVKCSELAFDKESVRSALTLQRIRYYSKDSDAFAQASQLIENAKKNPKQPFYTLILGQESELTQNIEKQKKLEAEPDYQACSGSSYEQVED